jgi:raffinose/stachyose/melibiose transport system permease protein
VFWFPPITRDPLCEGPFRGVGGAGVMYSVTQKNDPEHENNVVDFLMYLTTPESGRLLVETTLAEEQPLIGPILIQGVDLPEELASKFEPFTGHGFEKINFRGLADEQQSVAEWVSVAQQYFIGQIGQDEFLARYKQIMKDAVPRLRERFGYDLDPTTEDGPREFRVEKSLWNPFENGVLAVTLIALLFLGFGAYHVARARGAARTRTLTAYGLLLPTFLLLGTFSYSPALSGLYHAFTSWEEGRAATFTGLENFRGLVSDEVFWGGVVNMLILLTAGVIKATVIPFLAAEMILSLFRDRLRYFFRTAFLVPMVVPGMVGILIWRFIYDPNMGMLNRGLEALGLEQWTASWLGEVHLALPAIIFMGFPWVGALGLLIYMAGLMAVPESVYEAFALESDNVWRRIQRVDIPLVRGQTRLLIVLTFIQGLQDFQGILIMTGGGPVRATMVPALHMYYQAFRFSRFGYGAAIGFVLFVVILLATLINLKVLKPAEEL